MALLPSKVVAPVVSVEESESEGEGDPGDDVYLLGLEVEVVVPLDQRVGSSGLLLAVDDRPGRGRRIVGSLPPTHQVLLQIISIIRSTQI